MIKNNRLKILIGFAILAGIGSFVFYLYKAKSYKEATAHQNQNASNDNSFIETAVRAPAVEGNIINSGVAGKIVFQNGKPFEASLDVFSSADAARPVISVRSHSDGTFQIPLKPGSYVIKPADPDGPISPSKGVYRLTIGDSQWLIVKIEYK